MDSDLDSAVHDIISQLKTSTLTSKGSESISEDINPEDLEEFLVKHSGYLVTKSLNMVNAVGDYIGGAPENRDVSALAELIKASASAIDTLNKLHTSKEKNKVQLQTKQMDVDSREKMNTADNQTRMLLSREEVLKELLSSVNEPEDENIIDV